MSASASDDSILIHVGTGFGDASSPTQAILRLSLSRETGKLEYHTPPISTIAQGVNPGWISRYVTNNNNKVVVYVAMEDDPGLLQAYSSVDGGSTLTPLGSSVKSVGRNPCYCTLDSTGKWLFAAHYTEGSVSVVPVLEDGRLGPATDSRQHQGRIDEKLVDRQEGPHAHCIIPHPSNKWVMVADLGLSAVFCYGFDATTGTFDGSGTLDYDSDDDKSQRHLRLPPDAGCRHLCFDAAGTTLFIHNELACTVTMASFDVQTGTLTEVSTCSVLRDTDTPDRSHHRGGSDIHLHPNGRFLYVGCRSPSPGIIAIFEVVGSDETNTSTPPPQLKLVGHESTRGEVPRNFKLLGKEGNWLVVGNQETKDVVSYKVDLGSGKLTFVSQVSTDPYKPCNIASQEAKYA
mmetsp:Transcript_19260/g.32007  ORF Transcript_19260/g.32007 Transcript_19260/m.32007 type:complete len:403 (-) Transcript_19260:119-1327(-)|eukprot:CAMPEP_0119017402 /NCGR_PEP_ID=MMETSP1176-20130426/16445_1 /TAXON_ID=265551 /ORGANISM="Synedropsis recta cf, Strain CCMP1620" /LENGTH=402 /DNA_ID=CAMNT_0006971115 /DNA_START=53 /DNA_END=1261 /DNA_ORIENTATION=-